MNEQDTASLFYDCVAQLLLVRVPLEFDDSNILGPGIGATSFNSSDILIGFEEPKPEVITFNTDFLPFMDEDEVLYVLLHEAAHVNAGFYAQHGRKWAKMCDIMGIPAHEAIGIRRLPEFLDSLDKQLNVESYIPTFPERFIPSFMVD